MKNIHPVGDHILVQRDKMGATSKGGILLPDIAIDNSMLGTVLAVGPGRISDHGVKIPMSVKVGDRILIAKMSGRTVDLMGPDIFVIREANVLGVVEG